MKELFIVCAVVFIIVSGYFIMKKLDSFLENNRRLIDAEIVENSLFIAVSYTHLTLPTKA